mmetsp:Transcript_1864/g.2574  ORF Transcript_1864/g.2574 Transcript_1864/m.2574 type:complete len:854 (-) Transcript_1864:88-2649(-)
MTVKLEKKQYIILIAFTIFVLFALLTSDSDEEKSRKLTASSTVDCNTNVEPENVGETVHSLFGSILHVNSPGILIGAVVITIIIVHCVENSFEVFHSLTHESPFQQMINAIEKELMTVGFTALLFKVVFNSSKFLTPDWFFALELSDLLVPIYVFCSCMIGVLMVFTAMKQCFQWSRAYHLNLDEVLDEFYQMKLSKYLQWTLPFRPEVGLMEFRIYNIIFCEMYRMKRSVQFNEYLSIVFEKYILNLIETRPIDWLMLLMILILLMALSPWSNHAAWYGPDCHHSDECVANKEIQLFTIVGTLIFVATVTFAAVTRYYLMSVLKKRGIDGVSDYASFLQQMENQEDQPSEKNRLTEDELKAALTYSKEKKLREGKKTHTAMYYLEVYPSICYQFLMSIFCPKRKKSNVEEVQKMAAVVSGKYSLKSVHPPSDKSVMSLLTNVNGNSKRVNSLQVQSTDSSEQIIVGRSMSLEPVAEDGERSVAYKPGKFADMEEIENDDMELKSINDTNYKYSIESQVDTQLKSDDEEGIKSGKIKGGNSNLSLNLVHPLNEGMEVETSDRSSQGAKTPSPTAIRKQMTLRNSRILPEMEEGDNLRKTDSRSLIGPETTQNEANSIVVNKLGSADKATDFVVAVFLFGDPVVYFECLKVILMTNAAYLAFWLVHFLAACTGGWKFLTLLPGLFSAIVILFIAKSSVILKAITTLDSDAMLEVLEQTEGAKRLGEEIREKLLSRLSIEGDPFTKLFSLFHEIDDDGSNKLSRVEFEDLMHELDVHFSRKKWNNIFSEIDKNFDDCISFDEFFMFLYPENDAVKYMEYKRMKTIRGRVTLRAKEFEAKMMKDGRLLKSFSSTLV